MKDILLIEPDNALRKIYKAYLIQEGYSVVDAASAESAIHELDAAQSVDLIVLELQLANHNGLEFIHELRSYSEWQSIPILLHTFVPPHSLRFDKNTLKTLGILGYLYKPTTSLSTLVDAVRNVTLASV